MGYLNPNDMQWTPGRFHSDPVIEDDDATWSLDPQWLSDADAHEKYMQEEWERAVGL